MKRYSSKVSRKEYARPVNPRAARVDVWDYKDTYLQTEQIQDLHSFIKNVYLATINVNNKTITILGNDIDAKYSSQLNTGGNENYMLATTFFNSFPGTLLSPLFLYYLVRDDGHGPPSPPAVRNIAGFSPTLNICVYCGTIRYKWHVL